MSKVPSFAVAAAITPATRLVYLANPNNPTGTYLPFDEVKRLHARLPSDVLLVLDAAYAEYVRRNDYEAGIELVATAQNVVMTRTFSKIFGLAGLRIGVPGEGLGGLADSVRRPKFSTAAGLAVYGSRRVVSEAPEGSAMSGASVNGVIKWMRDWISDFF